MNILIILNRRVFVYMIKEENYEGFKLSYISEKGV